MCTNKKKVYNHYIQDFVYVDCGYCESCLQAKANMRANRIRNHAQSKGLVSLFVTLTYADKFVPYIRKSEIQIGKPISIYRNFERKKVNITTGSNYRTAYKNVPCGQIDSKELVFASESAANRYSQNLCSRNIILPTLRVNGKFDGDRVGVCYFEDVKNFIKRLKINYERKYFERLPFSYYACTEYGETYRRPHIHMLAFVPNEYKQRTIDTIYESWPYVDSHKPRVDVQVARNAASYVSSYVNCGSDFPLFLKQWFRPKCSYSRNFGCDNVAFNFPNLLDSVERGDMSYVCSRILDGQPTAQRLPLPYYVIHRYFPKCKGFGRLSDSEISSAVLSPFTLLSKRFETGLTTEELRKYAVRLRNAFERCKRYFGKRTATEIQPNVSKPVLTDYYFSRYEFARLFPLVWNAYKSTIAKYARNGLTGADLDYYYYDNIEDVYEAKINHNLGAPPSEIIYDSNFFPVNENRTAQLSDLYRKKKKQSRVSNFVMTDMGYDV